MSKSDTIHRIAMETLTTQSLTGERDDWLWDRTLRILSNIEHICRLPELAEKAISIDRFCLVAAAYFAESGLIHAKKLKKGMGKQTPSDVTNKDLCLFSTQTVSEKLSEVLSEARIEKINQIITESFNRLSDMTEAIILSEGRSLEDLGAAGLLHSLRKQLIDGKGVSGILENWKTKIEYGYWQARLEESFHFTVVRAVAKQRFTAVKKFMDQLAAENIADDLQEQISYMSQENNATVSRT